MVPLRESIPFDGAFEGIDLLTNCKSPRPSKSPGSGRSGPRKAWAAGSSRVYSFGWGGGELG